MHTHTYIHTQTAYGSLFIFDVYPSAGDGASVDEGDDLDEEEWEAKHPQVGVDGDTKDDVGDAVVRLDFPAEKRVSTGGSSVVPKPLAFLNMGASMRSLASSVESAPPVTQKKSVAEIIAAAGGDAGYSGLTLVELLVLGVTFAAQCVCVHVRACIYVCICMYVCMYLCMCLCICVYVCLHACKFLYLCMYKYVCMYVCMYVSLCLCMYEYVCMYDPDVLIV